MFSLEEIACNSVPQSIVFSEFSHWETIPLTVSVPHLGLLQIIKESRLSEYKYHIPMEACGFWWIRPIVAQHSVPIFDLIPVNVHHQPMKPIISVYGLRWN